VTTPRKYMFDLDFGPPQDDRDEIGRGRDRSYDQGREGQRDPDDIDDDNDEGLSEAPPPPPLFTEEDISVARDMAFEEGRRRGLTEAADTATQQTSVALAAIASQMTDLAARQAEAADEASRNAVKVALAAFKKMLPSLADATAIDEIVRVVGEVVGQVLDEPRIIVRVATSLAEPLRERLDEVADSHGFEGRVVLQPDARLASGDCRIEWADGGAQRDQARLAADIEATIERALAPPERRFAVATPDDKDLAEAGA